MGIIEPNQRAVITFDKVDNAVTFRTQRRHEEQHAYTATPSSGAGSASSRSFLSPSENPLVDFTPVSDSNDVDDNLCGMHLIDDSVIPHPYSVSVHAPAETDRTDWGRVFCQAFNDLFHPAANFLGELANFLGDGGVEQNPKARLAPPPRPTKGRSAAFQSIPGLPRPQAIERLLPGRRLGPSGHVPGNNCPAAS